MLVTHQQQKHDNIERESISRPQLQQLTDKTRILREKCVRPEKKQCTSCSYYSTCYNRCVVQTVRWSMLTGHYIWWHLTPSSTITEVSEAIMLHCSWCVCQEHEDCKLAMWWSTPHCWKIPQSDFLFSTFPDASGHYWTVSGQDTAIAACVERNGLT